MLITNSLVWVFLHRESRHCTMVYHHADILTTAGLSKPRFWVKSRALQMASVTFLCPSKLTWIFSQVFWRTRDEMGLSGLSTPLQLWAAHHLHQKCPGLLPSYNPSEHSPFPNSDLCQVQDKQDWKWHLSLTADATPEEPEAPHGQAELWTEKIVQPSAYNTALDSAGWRTGAHTCHHRTSCYSRINLHLLLSVLLWQFLSTSNMLFFHLCLLKVSLITCGSWQIVINNLIKTRLVVSGNKRL